MINPISISFCLIVWSSELRAVLVYIHVLPAAVVNSRKAVGLQGGYVDTGVFQIGNAKSG
jgi:hypothetical protein